MPVSKKRKKERPPRRRRRRREPEFVMTEPLWEYRSIAEQLAADDPELTVDKARGILLRSAFRLWDDKRRRIRTVFPSEMASAAGTSVDEWLNTMEVMFEGGLLSWDAENQAHYLSSRNQ